MSPERIADCAKSRLELQIQTLDQNLPPAALANASRISTRSNQPKQMDDTFKELTADFSVFHKKLDSMRTCLHGIFYTKESFESRLNALENR